MVEVLETLQESLQLQDLPQHIECFDNSNFQGAYPVAAMVCFKNGMPYKKEYRHFHIKTVEGINDFASMGEIVHRRYKRLLEEGKDLPQLVIIDGGKGQLNAALESIEKLGLIGRMTVVGLAKREESIFFPAMKILCNCLMIALLIYWYAGYVMRCIALVLPFIGRCAAKALLKMNSKPYRG